MTLHDSTPNGATAQTHKAIYARQFNTYPAYVRYWSELDDKQQSRATWVFGGESMDDYVYHIGITGVVICRRLLDASDAEVG